MEVTPTPRKGTLGTWWFRRSAGQSDAAPTISLTDETGLSFGQTTEVGAYTDQRLNLAKLGRLKEERPRLRTGPGKSGRPGLSGGLGKRSHGGNVNPPRNRKGEAGNPPSKTGALELYPNKRSADEASKTGMMTPKTGIFTLSREQHGRLPTYWPCGVRCIGGMTLIWAFVRNLRTGSVMRREKAQVETPRGRKYRCTDQGRTAS
jgi:hypothetical protein